MFTCYHRCDTHPEILTFSKHPTKKLSKLIYLLYVVSDCTARRAKPECMGLSSYPPLTSAQGGRGDVRGRGGGAGINKAKIEKCVGAAKGKGKCTVL